MADTSPIPPVDSEVPEGYGLYHADTRSHYDTLTEQFGDVDGQLIDTTITSPPYGDVKDYGYDEELQIGLGDDYEDYLEELRRVYKQTYDLTKPDGSLWVIVNTFKKGGRTIRLPTDIADICENLENKTNCDKCGAPLTKDRETGVHYCTDDECSFEYDSIADSWVLQDIVIWDKVRALPYSGKGKFRNVFEYILCFSKQNDFHFDLDKIRIADATEFKDWWINYPERYHPRGKVPDNIWEMVTPTQGGWGNMTIDHPAPFPRPLVERIIQLTTDPGDVVFDHFAGTGTVLAQAEAMNRWPLGFELSDDYVGAYSTLREEIIEEWKERQAEGNTLEEEQARLAQKIWRLRQLVFPRKLLQSLPGSSEERDLGELNINTVFLDGCADDELLAARETERVPLKTAIIVDDDTSEAARVELTESLAAAQEEDPCSAVPVDADVSVQTVSEFVGETANEFEASPLYLYDKNDYNYPAGTITIETWDAMVQTPDGWRQNHVAYEYPPVISNLYLNVDSDGKEVVTDIEEVRASEGGATLTDF
ncbi:site-specific DNA-methyltransferase [Natronomonas salina]|uniref:DNA-methyltransferase n=1 Tax=Natronomonas salina TaxID=1710540 RepID=UPI0015B6A6A4|nr:site-specific DNA-methyltransferase [Natronomonas salina]QLD89111.1 site-specific DNA-methyltransferase [Natronomonas salina]